MKTGTFTRGFREHMCTRFPHLHARSYLRARAGVTHKEFTFGLGANMEYYGPLKHNENNFGAFLQVALF